MKLRNAYKTLRDRGVQVLFSASYSLIRARVEQRVRNTRFVKRQIHTYQMLLDIEDPGLSRALLLFGERELDHKILLERALSRGDTALDIGANIGYYSLMERNIVGPDGRVIAVEPVKRNVELLRRNVELNGYENIKIVHAAVSDIADERTIYLSTKSNLNTFHPDEGVDLTGEEEHIRTLSVPDLIERTESPDLIRMDIEGHEAAVFDGILDSIRNGDFSGNIIFEPHTFRYSEDQREKMETALSALYNWGYQTSYASSTHRGASKFYNRGYECTKSVRTDGITRRIFQDIDREDVIDLVCHAGGIRTVLLTPQKP